MHWGLVVRRTNTDNLIFLILDFSATAFQLRSPDFTWLFLLFALSVFEWMDRIWLPLEVVPVVLCSVVLSDFPLSFGEVAWAPERFSSQARAEVVLQPRLVPLGLRWAGVFRAQGFKLPSFYFLVGPVDSPPARAGVCMARWGTYRGGSSTSVHSTQSAG